MTIKIKPEADIVISRSEYEQYERDYTRDTSMMVDPPSFEDYVRGREAEKEVELRAITNKQTRD